MDLEHLIVIIFVSVKVNCEKHSHLGDFVFAFSKKEKEGELKNHNQPLQITQTYEIRVLELHQ